MISNLISKIELLFLHPEIFIERARAKIKARVGGLDENTKLFIKHNKKVWEDWRADAAKYTVLFDYYPIAETEVARSYLLNILAKKHKAKIVSYSVNKPHNKVWDLIYNSYNVSEHVYIQLTKEQKKLSNSIYKDVIANIKTKKDIFNLNIFGVWVGVDIYEEFLMKFTEPTVIVNDYRLNSVIKEGIDALVFWKEYFENNEVKAVISSHIGVRIEKNLICKIAGQLFDIPFYSTHARSMVHYPKPHLYHQEVAKHYISYHDKFKKLQQDVQKEGLIWAKDRIQKRLSGTVGVDMAYSTKSAFTSNTSKTPVLNTNDRIKILITTHEFYDSPNCYGGLIFIDFYEWLMFLVEISKKTNYDWYVKTHPDVSPETAKIINKIVKNSSHFQLVPPTTSFHQLAEEGVEYVLTCYGSVGHECPLLGMKVINAGNNPHMGYNFNWNPKTLEEYEDLLMHLEELEKEVTYDDIYEFYYMNYKETGIIDDWIYPSYKKLVTDLTETERLGSAVFPYFLDSLSPEKHQQIISRMTKFIDSGITGSPKYNL